VRAIEIFCEMLGNIAGDLVLAYGAWNGVYLGGGLLEPLLPQLRAGGFRRRFEAKGRFSQRLQSVPIAAIIHPQPGLLGAAALTLADSGPHSTVPLSSI
jgi:glucokinase